MKDITFSNNMYLSCISLGMVKRTQKIRGFKMFTYSATLPLVRAIERVEFQCPFLYKYDGTLLETYICLHLKSWSNWQIQTSTNNAKHFIMISKYIFKIIDKAMYILLILPAFCMIRLTSLSDASSSWWLLHRTL